MQKNPPSTNVWIGNLPATIEKTQFLAIFSQYGTIASARIFPPKSPGQPASAMVRFDAQDAAKYVVENLDDNIVGGLPEPIACNYGNPERVKEGKEGKEGKAAGGKGSSPFEAQFQGMMNWMMQAMGGKGCGKGFGGGAVPGTWRASPYGGKNGAGFWGAKSGNSKGDTRGSANELYDAIKKSGFLGGGTVPQECTLYVKCLPDDSTDLLLYQLFSPFGAIASSGVKAMLHADGTCKGFGFVDYVDPVAAAQAVISLNGFALPNGEKLIVALKSSSSNASDGAAASSDSGRFADMNTFIAGELDAPSS